MITPTEHAALGATTFPGVGFINHQNWQISCRLSAESGRLVFDATDPHGIQHVITEFLVEDLTPTAGEELQQIEGPQAQQLHLFALLQKKLEGSTRFQIHIEEANGGRFIRFGSYGLQGGFGKGTSYFISGVQVMGGIVLCGTGIGGPAGAVLVSSGLGGGLHAFNEKGDEVDGWKYARQTGYGALSGLVSGGVGSFGSGATGAAKYGWQILSGVAGSASAQTTEKVVEEGKLPGAEELAQQVGVSALSGAAGAGAGKIVGGVLGSKASVAGKVAKGVFKGAASSGASKSFAKRRRDH